MKKIEFDGTGDGTTDKGVHFQHPIQDYTMCGITLDGDPDTAGGYTDTDKKVTCLDCITMVTHCKAVKKSEYIKVPSYPHP